VIDQSGTTQSLVRYYLDDTSVSRRHYVNQVRTECPAECEGNVAPSLKISMRRFHFLPTEVTSQRTTYISRRYYHMGISYDMSVGPIGFEYACAAERPFLRRYWNSSRICTLFVVSTYATSFLSAHSTMRLPLILPSNYPRLQHPSVTQKQRSLLR
jgi:hypothetical protein